MSLEQARQKLDVLGVEYTTEADLLVTEPEAVRKVQRSLPAHQSFRELADQKGLLLSGARVVPEPTALSRGLSRSRHWRELEWLETHREELEKHRGRWIVVQPDGIAASAESGEELYRRVQDLGLREPFVHFVSLPDPRPQI